MALGVLWIDCRRFWCTGMGKARWEVKRPRRAQNAPGIKARQKKGASRAPRFNRCQDREAAARKSGLRTYRTPI
jgi:hypothetical protein